MQHQCRFLRHSVVPMRAAAACWAYADAKQALGCTGKNKAKMAVSVAIAAKPEIEIWRRPKKINFLTLFSYLFLQTVSSTVATPEASAGVAGPVDTAVSII